MRFSSTSGLSSRSRDFPARQLVLAVAYACACAYVLAARSVVPAVILALAPLVVVGISPVRSRTREVVEAQAVVAWLTLLAVAIPWQTQGAEAVGNVEVSSPLTLAKLGLTIMACGLAFYAAEGRPQLPWQGKMILVYALIAGIGGCIFDDPVTAVLRTGRFTIVCLAVLSLTTVLSRRQLILWFVAWVLGASVLALIAHAVGLTPGTRLSGYLPPIHPNGLAIEVGAALVFTCALWALGQLRGNVAGIVVPVLFITLLLTQSRTIFIAATVGIILIGLYTARSRGLTIAAIVAVAAVSVLIVQSTTEVKPATSLVTHNGTSTTTGSLESRRSEWESVVSLNNSPLKVLVGQGLASKAVEVSLRSARFASVDGMWAAAYLSAGIAGVVVLLIVLLGSLREAVSYRDCIAATMLVYLTITSFTTDTLNDISIGLLLLLATSVSTQILGARKAVRGNRDSYRSALLSGLSS